MPCIDLMSTTNSMAMTAYSSSSGVLIEGCALPLSLPLWVVLLLLVALPLSHWIGGVMDGLLRIVGRS